VDGRRAGAVRLARTLIRELTKDTTISCEEMMFVCQNVVRSPAVEFTTCSGQGVHEFTHVAFSFLTISKCGA